MFKQKINPYRKFAGDIYKAFNNLIDFFLWNISTESAKSRKKMLRLKDSQKGKKAVILFNGPSLLRTDFSLLDGIFTFGLNKINLISDEIDFVPSLIVAFDEILNIQNSFFLKNSQHLNKILNYRSYKHLKKTGDDLIYLYHIADDSFCYEALPALANRGSTPYITFQIAYYMGFEEIAIIGADHNFPDIKPLAVVENNEEDKFHFHKDYHKKGEKNQYPDKIKLDMNFRDVRLAFEEKGRKVYNATEGGHLEIFERISLKDFLEDKKTNIKTQL
jgi:hypothetical protein